MHRCSLVHCAMAGLQIDVAARARITRIFRLRSLRARYDGGDTEGGEQGHAVPGSGLGLYTGHASAAVAAHRAGTVSHVALYTGVPAGKTTLAGFNDGDWFSGYAKTVHQGLVEKAAAGEAAAADQDGGEVATKAECEVRSRERE